MNTDTQNMIAESAQRLFTRAVDRRLLEAAESGEWQAALWQEIEDSGFASVLVPESAGGISGRWTDAYPLLHALGYYTVPLPVPETIVAAGLLARAGMEVPAGPLTVIQQGRGLKLALRDGRIVLDGCVESVPWARHAAAIIVAGEADGKPVLARVDAKSAGLAIAPRVGTLREPRDVVTFTHCTAADCKVHALPVDCANLFGALARAIMIVGALEAVLDKSVQYANERIQFGKPIGKFQALQQSLALQAGEVTAAKSAVVAAVESATDTGEFPSRFAVTVAKARAGMACGTGASVAHAVHGAIGFTQEHSLHFSTRRLWSWRAEFGADRDWALALGRNIVKRGGKNFWTDLTARTSI